MDKNRAKPGTIDQIERKDTDLSPLVVRPITLNEDGIWEDLMSTHHYLGFNSKTLTGKTLKYVAVLNGQWIALRPVGFQIGICCFTDQIFTKRSIGSPDSG